MKDVIRSLLSEPRVSDPPKRTRWDWLLVVVLAVTAVVEGVLLGEVGLRPVAIGAGILIVFTLPWRRSNSLLAVAIAFGAMIVVWTAALATAESSPFLGGPGIGVLILTYSLVRWASGREVSIGVPIILATNFVVNASEETSGVLGSIVAIAVLLVPATIGVMMRYRANVQVGHVQNARLLERERLARELHDTVAHHFSAIAVQAQAGRSVAVAQPGAALDIFDVIKQTASRALVDMRDIVGALREGEVADVAPQQGIPGIQRLAEVARDGPKVAVHLSGDLKNLSPIVNSALYRIAQESITNARRHSRHARRVVVRVHGAESDVQLTITDDGDSISSGRKHSPGFGIIGMTERARLLGGTLEAGPDADRGWTISAVLPRSATGTPA